MCDLMIRQGPEGRLPNVSPPGRAGSSVEDPDPDFLYVAPSKTACAAFSKESRMKLASAAEVRRKSGGAP